MSGAGMMKRMLWGLLFAVSSVLSAQTGLFYTWQVTHTKSLAARLVGAEAARATLESNIAAQQAFGVSIGNFKVAEESYDALRTYAKVLKLIRMARQVANAYKSMDFRGREWALLPQIRMTAPAEVGKDADGNPIINDQEMFSLTMVPPELQTDWDLTKYPNDDLLSNRNPTATAVINFDFPHKLSDVQFTWTPSPFLEQNSDPESGMAQLMAHGYEALLTAAARLSGYGVRVNTQVLADGSVLLPGRASPGQIKLQASIYETQALGLIDKIVRLYIDHGMSINNAEKRVVSEREYWTGFSDRVMTNQSARVAFSMNLMKEINQTISRLETFDRVSKDAESDDLLKNMGKKRQPDGTYASVADPKDIFDVIDQALHFNPNGDAVKLQARGLQARYAHSQFEEVQGWRNIMVGLMRAETAMEGVQQVQQTAKEVAELESGTGPTDWGSAEEFKSLLDKLKSKQTALKGMGWGGTIL